MNGGRGHFFLRRRAARGATVNNCTLNIDQGTVLAFTAFNYEWAIRLNPGGRLNVNGVPTNRVVFARLEAVQEFPAGWPAGPYVTFKGVFVDNGTVMVTPLPEARLHYADFPTLAGDATHFGPLTGDQTYDCVAALELNGCLLQGGTFLYEAGGPQGRILSLHNTIFERSLVSIKSLASLHGDYSETLTTANNLFYRCDMWLESLNSGSGWTFIDNLFDNATFHGRGPATVNKNNGYVNMSASHLAGTEVSPKDLSTLAYQTGPLGRFYLPTAATTLLGGGSRSAGAAGLFHFRIDG